MIFNARKLLGMQNQADDQVRVFWLPDLVIVSLQKTDVSSLVSSLISEKAVFLSFESEVPIIEMEGVAC